MISFADPYWKKKRIRHIPSTTQNILIGKRKYHETKYGFKNVLQPRLIQN